jgi:hypothetical protein
VEFRLAQLFQGLQPNPIQEYLEIVR